MSEVVPSDTAPIRSEERFDEAAVAAYLRTELPELFDDAPITFAQFPGGAANLTYLARSGDTEVVLRRPPLGEVAKSGHDMEREHRVLSRLWRAFPKAPRAYLYCADPDVMGKDFFVMERRHGHVIRGSWPAGFGIDERRRTARDLVATLGELHHVDPSSVGLADLGHPDGFVTRQVAGWLRRWDAAKTRDVPDMEVAARLLDANVPSPQAAVILHNDYKLDNTMVANGGELVAVFDWDMCTRGDPLVDLGTLLAYWPDEAAPTYPVLGDRAVTLSPYLGRNDVVEAYAHATGFDVSGISYFEGLALFRIAVIIEQIYARYVAGATSDERFAAFEPLAPILAEASAEALSA